MSFALLNHRNFDRTTANAGYTGVAIFQLPPNVALALENDMEDGRTPEVVENYLERIWTLTQNIDSDWRQNRAWSEALTLEDGMLTGANSDKEAEPGEALRSTSVGDRINLAITKKFSGIFVYEFEAAKFTWKYNGQTTYAHQSLTEEA